MKILKSIFLIGTILTLGYSPMLSQKLTHILGEVIVEVRDNKGAQSLMSDLNDTKSLNSQMKAKQIMTEPMNLWVVSIDPNKDNELEFLDRIKGSRHTLLAQQNHISQLRDTIPNDPLFESQWQYINLGTNGGVVGADIDMELAWEHTTGGATTDGDEIVVCVIDDGIADGHPDLGDNLWINSLEIPDNGIDDDENGYIDDVRGWNAYNDSDNVYVGGGHGTPVAGIIGAQGNNEIGVAGVNWDVKLMIVRGGSPESTALASYAYPYTMRKLYNETNGEKGAFVVSTNASWGVDFGQPEDAPIWCDFYNRLGEVGILNFGATINNNVDVDAMGDLPTACDSDFLVSVTNMNRSDVKVTGAGFGTRTIDLGAFGQSTYTLTSGDYGGFGGTSGATPHVAGTAALLYSTDCADFMQVVKSDPAQAALAIKDYILHGVDYNESLQGITTTGGRLNANNAVLNALNNCGECTPAYGAKISLVDTSSVSLTWLDNGKIGTVSLRYKAIDEEDWIEVVDVSSGFEFTGLMFCTMYEYQIKTSCPDNEEAYSYPRVFSTKGCCLAPEGLVGILDGNVATIDWDGVTTASNFVIEYKNVLEEDWIAVELDTTRSFTLENVEDCESYEIRVKSKCAITSNESEYSQSIFVTGDCGACTMEYCMINEKDNDGEWISNVTIEGVFTNESGADENGYKNFVNQFEIELSKGEQYSLQLTPSYSGQEWNEVFTVYMDIDQSGTFEEDELIFENEETTVTAVSGTIILPEEALEGLTRMRVVMRFDERNGPCDEGQFNFGEVEDYCVTILPGADCPTSYLATIVDSLATSLQFSIEEDERAEMYILDYRVVGTDDFQTLMLDTGDLLIEDLLECTEYEYRSSIICAGGRRPDSEIAIAKTVCPTSIQELDQAEYRIYPNPVSQNLTIELKGIAKEGGFIKLKSIDGQQLVATQRITQGQSQFVLNLESISSGIYILDFVVGEMRSIRKIIKM